jgi:hypothetical protein
MPDERRSGKLSSMRRRTGRCAVRTGRFAVAALLAATLAACGTSDRKRSVDARTEVLRFFGVDSPTVALLGPQPNRSLRVLNRVAAGIPAWDQVRDGVLGPLHNAGIGPADLQRLVRPQNGIEDVTDTAAALGAPVPAGPGEGTPLMVLATDQTELLEQLLREAAAAGEVRAAGELDGALLYQGDSDAYAIRDGVLVSASTLAEVRAAVERRDGDSDAQLDEDVVHGVLDDLRTAGPLDVYANLGQAVDSDPELSELASRVPWVASLHQGALTARVEGPSVRLEMVASTDRENLAASELPVSGTPSRFALTSAGVSAVLPGRGVPTDPIAALLYGLTPLVGEATATTDEVRASVSVSP